ncbi:type II secretion system protein GspM [Marilutibacter maris]|uniref:Type II secretion system protein M n=1 Tax=Marilutibacter maris TaxID=1605891 RepID=A0A2U9TF46_9GAMM|nr:type II secretion system protein GspM [Lysobacter maris]AWV06870.1 type II secretion system protein M [Lysobacter maris]KAB8192961.1 type II secretion system protein M [Lysobacter maris]
MNGQPRRIAEWWRARDDRERTMVATMLVMLAAFAYWYALLTPLRYLRDAARAGYDRAAADATAVRGLASELRLVRERDDRGRPGTRALLDSAADAGIAVSRRRRDEHGALVLGIDRVQSEPLFAWLAGLRHDHGIGPDTLHVERRDGALRVEVGFDTLEAAASTGADAGDGA